MEDCTAPAPSRATFMKGSAASFVTRRLEKAQISSGLSRNDRPCNQSPANVYQRGATIRVRCDHESLHTRIVR